MHVQDGARALASHAYFDLGPGSVLDCIPHQIGNDLRHSIRVPLSGQFPRSVDVHAGLRMRDPELFHRSRGDLRKIRPRFEIDGNATGQSRSRQVEQLLDHPVHACGAGSDPPEHGGLRRERSQPQEKIGRHRDGSQWIAQVMAEDPDELLLELR